MAKRISILVALEGADDGLKRAITSAERSLGELSTTAKTAGARPVPVLARQMDSAFCIERSAGGDLLRGAALDWLLQYAPGDYGIVENARFQAVYRPV